MIRTLPQLGYDPTRPEDVNTGQEDHLYDAMKYFLMSDPIAVRYNEKAQQKEYSPLDTAPIEKYSRFIV